MGDCEIRLGSYDHAERLQVGIRFDVGVAVVIERKFSEIHWTSLRRNRPGNVGQEFESELCGILEALKFGVDLEIRLLAFNFRLTRGALG